MTTNYDTAIYNAEIIDGTGAPAYSADLAIKDSRIVKIGFLGDHSAKSEIDAAGNVVSPGFIDSHSHADLSLLANGLEDEKLKMGVTTEVIGQCGFSPYPLSEKHKALRIAGISALLPGVKLSWQWSDLFGYKAAAINNGLNHHAIPLVGHGSIRQAAMGDDPGKPTPAQLDTMRRLTDEAMKQGAFGLSSGLIYTPGVFSETDELIELCRVVADNGGFYVTHVRGETEPLVESGLDEALAVSREAGLPLQISHLKVIGLDEQSRGKIEDVLAKIEAAGESGMDAQFDCYPYTDGSTFLSALIPRWAHDGGVYALLEKLKSPKWRGKIRESIEADDYEGENWLMACGFDAVRIGSMNHPDFKPFVGMDLAGISAETGKNPFDGLFDIILAEEARTIMVFSMMREEDMLKPLTHPLGTFGTDALPCPPGQGKPHPRGYGTFPRILGKYARDEERFSLEEAVHKMTGRAAKKFGLIDRGVISEGMAADLVIFDKKSIMDKADYQDPRRSPTGIRQVLVEGVPALIDGKVTGQKAGHFL